MPFRDLGCEIVRMKIGWTEFVCAVGRACRAYWKNSERQSLPIDGLENDP
jgi:hypothetical protein